MSQIVAPVLSKLSQKQLKGNMPFLNNPNPCIQAFSRCLCGITPYLELDLDQNYSDDEKEFQSNLRNLSLLSIDEATNPKSCQYMDWTQTQSLVEAGFLSHALIRAPKQIAAKLDNSVRKNLINALILTRKTKPHNCNWLLFSAMVETALCLLGATFKFEIIENAVSHFLEWYKGDGLYGDGDFFHFDYYNSFVIVPMLVDIVAGGGGIF
jgi:hypothetical protein